METLTEFFEELVQDHETTLKKSTKHCKSADRMLKHTLRDGGDAHIIKAHLMEKKREAGQMEQSLKAVGYYKRMVVAAKGILMPCPTSDPARLYVGGDGHPRICKEFNFPRKDGALTNTVRISSRLDLVRWNMNRKVSQMEWGHVRYLTRPRKNLPIPYCLLVWMIRSADWWSAINFCAVNADMVYSMIKMNIGRYAGVDGHQNVVCGCGYDSKVLQFVVSTARPHLQSWIRTIDLLRPIALLQNTIYVPVECHTRGYKETHFQFSSIIRVGGHCSRTYDRGPRRFHKCAAHSIYLQDRKPIKMSWL